MLVGIPAALILKQPDLGTAIALAMGAFTVLLVAGLPVRLLVIAALIVGPLLPYGWHHLKPYQQRRLTSFVDPQADPLGAGYHVLQSQIAIGSGQVHGKGYLHGTQNQLNFLPEQHTDFIFSVFAEEWGFVGAVVLLLLYLALILRGAYIASRARDNLGALLAAGLTATIFWQVVINIAMTSGVVAGGRHHPAVPQLRRLVDARPADVDRPADEHQHAALHVSLAEASDVRALARRQPALVRVFTLPSVPRRGTKAERVLRTARADATTSPDASGSLTGRISPEPAWKRHSTSTHGPVLVLHALRP